MDSSLIALLTDFGTGDSFVGVMKGVILGIAPQAKTVDITHDVSPQNVRLGAYHLMVACPYFPAGTLFAAIVDPGVGSKRRILYVETANYRFLGPDNGILSWALKDQVVKKTINVTESKYFLKKVSSTFHGRDIFAPVSAHLVNGLRPEKLGATVRDYVHLPFPEVVRKKNTTEGEIISIDRFGNLVTNFKPEDLSGNRVKIKISGKTVKYANGLYRNYAQAQGETLAVVEGSFGFVEISAPMGNAAAICRARISDKLKCSTA